MRKARRRAPSVYVCVPMRRTPCIEQTHDTIAFHCPCQSPYDPDQARPHCVGGGQPNPHMILGSEKQHDPRPTARSGRWCTGAAPCTRTAAPSPAAKPPDPWPRAAGSIHFSLHPYTYTLQYTHALRTANRGTARSVTSRAQETRISRNGNREAEDRHLPRPPGESSSPSPP